MLLTGAALSAAACAEGQKQVQPKPNVVFILADDLGWGDLSCYGQTNFRTPNIDRLASEGLRFTQCYSGTTVSAPSRSCLVTGTHSGHTAIRGNMELQPEGQFPLPADAVTIFHDLKAAGYTTGAFGKWGLGFVGSTGDPQKMGVDSFYGYNCQLLAHSYYADHIWDNGNRVALADNCDEVPYGEGSYIPDLIHEKALQFIDDAVKNGEPFFMWYPTTIPHAELIVPQDSIIQSFVGKYPEKPFKGCDQGMPGFRKGGYCSQQYPHATFAAMVTRLDLYVGQIVGKLKELGDSQASGKYLHPCIYVTRDRNCGHCSKCVRTLAALKALGEIEKYRDLFDIDDFNAMGYFYIDITDYPRPVEFAGLRLMLAQRVDRKKKDVLIPKLFELNLNFRNGIFYVDDFGNIFYEAKFPVARDNIQDALASFMVEYLEISDYLDVNITSKE